MPVGLAAPLSKPRSSGSSRSGGRRFGLRRTTGVLVAFDTLLSLFGQNHNVDAAVDRIGRILVIIKS